MLHTNHKSSNFNKRVNPAMLVKNASTQASPHTPYNPQLNSTLTKLYNNYSNNRYTNSGSTQKNYSFNNYKKDDKATDAKPPNISSKLPYTRGQPSNDKASNPICYKCGKIRFARDCLKHPYKARIFTLGINGELIEDDTVPQDHQAKGGGEISPELDPMGANDIPDGDGVEDQYVDNPYDPTHFEIVDEEDKTPETQDKSASFNMLSFIKDSGDDYVLKLATVRDNMGVGDSASRVTDSSGSKIPNKIVKHSPPILDAKLRLSREAGKYPADRSADLRRTLTAEVNIGGVDAFVLFDSGAETDALSPDFVRACHIPLLELPNPLVLRMGTKGSRSCVYYGTNVHVIIHRFKNSHYFDIVNIDLYDMVLGVH